MQRPSKHLKNSEGGFFLILVPIIVVALVILGYQAISRSTTSMRISGRNMNHLQMQMGANQCLSLATNSVQFALENNSTMVPGSTPCENTAKQEGSETCDAHIGDQIESTINSCYGYYMKSTEVDFRILCRDPSSSQSAELEAKVAYGEIPIFQFAVFFEKYLAMHASETMVVNGRVHGNDTIELSPHGTLHIHDWVTTPKAIMAYQQSAKSRLHFALMSAGGVDPSPFPLGSSTLKPLHELKGDWSSWVKNRRIAYGGNPNGCGEVQRLSLPMRNIYDYHTIIDWRQPDDGDSRRRQKFAWKASLIYQGGLWRTGDLVPIALPAALTAIPAKPKGWATTLVDGTVRLTFWYSRDTVMVKVVPIDVSTLQERSPSDSIIYLHDSLIDPSQKGKDIGGFLLHNGKKLTRPITIATNSRMFVLGDYNTDSLYVPSGGGKFPFPTALISDAIIQLSNDFLPGEHSQGKGAGSSIKERNSAASVTFNGCVITGMTEMQGTWNNQGGYQSLVRFMEDWIGVTYHKSGSMAALWSTKISKGQWIHGSQFYDTPDRDFSYSNMYNQMANMPPGTPRVVTPTLLDRESVRR